MEMLCIKHDNERMRITILLTLFLQNETRLVARLTSAGACTETAGGSAYSMHLNVLIATSS